MTDIQQLLERQAKWQKARGVLSWPEKIRLAEAMREAIHQLRSGLEERRQTQTALPPPQKVN